MREGKVGRLELISMLCISCISIALFSFPSYELYSNGNSSYIVLPCAMLLAYGAFLIIEGVIRRGGFYDLHDMLTRKIGTFAAQLFRFFIAIQLIFSAALPLVQYLNMMHSYIFDTSYVLLAFYVSIPIIVLSWLGFESISRISKIVLPIILILMLVLIIVPIDNYQVYRMHPIPGNSLGDMSLTLLAAVDAFFLILITFLYFPQCTHGTQFYRKSAGFSVLISLVVVVAIQLAISMTYTSSQLSMLDIPLLSLNGMTPAETYSVRIEKISMFVLIAGCFIYSALGNYFSANMLAKTFKQKDIRPFALVCGYVVTCVVLVICASSELKDNGKPVSIIVRMICFGITFAVLLLGILLRTRKRKVKTA